MLCMLAARDFAEQRDRLRLFIMRHRYVGGMKAGPQEHLGEFANFTRAGGSRPGWNYANVISCLLLILMAFYRSVGPRFTLLSLAGEQPRRNLGRIYRSCKSRFIACRFSETFIGISHKLYNLGYDSVAFRENFSANQRDRCSR